MSPRRHPRQPAPSGRGRAPAPERTERGPDGEWVVRPVHGAGATKTYRCPGCDHEIAPGVAHLVVWPVLPGLLSLPDDDFGGGRSSDEVGGGSRRSGASERRHWHRPCWAKRSDRHRRW